MYDKAFVVVRFQKLPKNTVVHQFPRVAASFSISILLFRIIIFGLRWHTKTWHLFVLSCWQSLVRFIGAHNVDENLLRGNRTQKCNARLTFINSVSEMETRVFSTQAQTHTSPEQGRNAETFLRYRNMKTKTRERRINDPGARARGLLNMQKYYLVFIRAKAKPATPFHRFLFLACEQH